MGDLRRRHPLATQQVRSADDRSAMPACSTGGRPLKPLAELDGRAVRAVLFDIDDTLTTAGKLTAEAYTALEALNRAGKRTVAVTGRPAGWCDHIARMWPVDAVVGENGALYMIHDHGARKLIKRYAVGESDRQAARARLSAIGERIVRTVPGCALASDQPYREAD